MDSISFYQPPSTSKGKSRHFPGKAVAPYLQRGSNASLPDCPTTRIVSTLSQKTHTSDLPCGIGKHGSTASRRPTNHDGYGDQSDDDFPDLKELLSGTRQKSLPTSTDSNGDDYDGFIDIDELLPDVEQKGPTSVESDCGGMAADMVGLADNGTRVDSSIDSGRSTAGSSRDPIILNDGEDEFTGAESETDYSSLNADVIAENDPSSPRIADGNMGDGDDSSVVDGARLQLTSELPMSASLGHGSDRLQVYYIQPSTEATKRSASFQDVDVTKEVEDEGLDVFAGHQEDADTCSTRSSGSPAVSRENPDSDNNDTFPELRGSQHESAPCPQPVPALASLEQSDLKDDPPPRRSHRPDGTKRICRKRLRVQVPTEPTRTATHVSAALESKNFGDAQPAARLLAPAKQRDIRDSAQEMLNDGGTDDSNDEDYDDMSDGAASEGRRSPRSRKRVKQVKDMTDSNVGSPSARSLDAAHQATTITPSVSMQESEAIPIGGHWTVKIVGSRVVYCLEFSQELLPYTQHQGRTQDSPTDLDKRQSASPDSAICQKPLQHQATRRPWTPEEDAKLLRMKKEGHSWEEIHAALPHRSKGTMQVRYSTRLKDQ